MRRLLVVLAVLLLGVTLAGCTGVPTSSAPQVVRTEPVGGEDEPSDTISPQPGEQPQTLVQDFLQANASDAGRHASAKAFLTSGARSLWTDTTATVLDASSIGAYNPGTRTVVVTGRQLGAVAANGVYTPSLPTAPTQFTFSIVLVDGQYRINGLNTGLLLDKVQFAASFDHHNVYFFDPTHRFLVPDARWIPRTDAVQVSETLVNQIAAGPSDDLQAAVSTDTLPTQANTRHINVTGGDPIRMEIAGSSQLLTASKDRLAAQIAATLSDVDRGRSLQITDSGAPVRIPDAGGSEFSSSDFLDTLAQSPVGEVYYVRGGRVIDERRRLVSGAVNTGDSVSSIAVSRSSPGGGLSFAGVSFSQELRSNQLLVGTQNGGLRPTSVRGVTSRPAFAPDRVEAWVGAGTKVYRVTFAGTASQAATVALPTSVAGRQVLALRLSPEGARIAMVLEDAQGHKQVFTGDIVRTLGNQVRIDTLQQISPDNVSVTDLAWVENQRLDAIGTDEPSGAPRVYQVGADGSAWTEADTDFLPAAPTTLTVALGEPAWVTAGTSVRVQAGGTRWANPSGSSQVAYGGAPVYVE